MAKIERPQKKIHFISILSCGQVNICLLPQLDTQLRFLLPKVEQVGR